MKFDAVIVGAGLAGITCAIQLARHHLRVLVFERGEYPGSKNMAGGIIYTPVLQKLYPNFLDEAPLERYVAKKRIAMLSEEDAVTMEFYTRAFSQPPHNHSFTVLRSRFDRWYAKKAEEEGVTMVTETVVDDVIREDGRIVGVRARRDQGDVRADCVVIADGANSLLAERAGLRGPHKANHFVVGAKEVFELPSQVIDERFGLSGDEGIGMDLYGYPPGLLASGFLYTNKQSLSFGIGAYLHSLAALKLNILDAYEALKKHQYVRRMLAGARPIEYTGHLIPEAAYEGQTYTDGAVVIGDAASLLNPSPIYFQGTNLAMASGLSAAEAVKRASEAGDFSKESLAYYWTHLAESGVIKDVRRYSKVPKLLEKNPRLITVYPRLAGELLRILYTEDERPKSEKSKELISRVRKEVGLIRGLRDLLQIYRNFL